LGRGGRVGDLLRSKIGSGSFWSFKFGFIFPGPAQTIRTDVGPQLHRRAIAPLHGEGGSSRRGDEQISLMITTFDKQTLLCWAPVRSSIVHREFALTSSQERMKAHNSGVMMVAEDSVSHFTLDETHEARCNGPDRRQISGDKNAKYSSNCSRRGADCRIGGSNGHGVHASPSSACRREPAVPQCQQLR
jgi:hypothetical protein